MQKPVFLSVGGQRDAAFASRVHQLLGDTLAYHYQLNGEESVEFRAEIQAQINGCHVFVAFWSDDYLKSEHACNELAYFRKLTESTDGLKKHLLVVPREADKPEIQSKWKNPITQKDEFVLGRWRNDRAIDPGADPLRISQLIKRNLEANKVISEVLIPRGWLTDQFKRESTQPDFLTRELMIITGLEGDGRRTALRQYMRQTHPHLVERSVSLNSIDGPDDLLIHLMEVTSMSASARTLIMNSIQSGAATVTKEVRKILHQARENKSYYIIAVDRFAGVDGISIPHWLSDVMAVFKLGSAPIVFIVTSSPVTAGLIANYPSGGRIRIPGLEGDEIRELVHRLSIEDPNPNRWTASKKDAVANASGSSPSLCKSIMRSMATEPTLDFVDEISKRAEDNFGEALSALMKHWIEHYASSKSDLFALQVIEKLGITSKEALDDIMQPIVAKHGDFDLYTLRDQGLVEQLSDGVYRIPPLVQRRLSTALWGTIKAVEIDFLFSGFSKRIFIAKSEYGAIYASNAALVSVSSGSKNIAPEYAGYLTIATLFKAGLERYSRKEWQLAHNILQRAMSQLKNNPVIDITTQIEICRFAGLAAARRSDHSALEQACLFLETSFQHSRRRQSADAMASFIRGFNFRIGRAYDPAIRELRKALQLLSTESHVERQRAAIYTELAASYLRTSPPQFSNALEMAQAAFHQKDVIHTLNAYVHALVLFVFRSGQFSTVESINNKISEIEGLLERLKERSTANGQDFHGARNSEFQSEMRWWRGRSKSTEEFSRAPTKEAFTPAELDFL